MFMGFSTVLSGSIQLDDSPIADAVQAVVMRAGIAVSVTPADRGHLAVWIVTPQRRVAASRRLPRPHQRCI